MVSRQRSKFKRLSAILKIPNTHIPKGSIQILQLFSPDSVDGNLLCGDCPAIFCSSIAKHACFYLEEFAQKINSIHSVFVFLVKNKPAIIAKFSWPSSISLLSTGIPLMENSDCLFVTYIHCVTVYKRFENGKLLSPGHMDQQVVASGCKLNLHIDFHCVTKQTRKFPCKYKFSTCVYLRLCLATALQEAK